MATAALLVPLPASAASKACTVIAPIRAVNATPMYSDTKGSITDEAKAAVSRQQLSGIDTFFKAMEAAVDGPADAATLTCAFEQFRAWAEAGAMTETASNEGAIQRLEYLVGLEIIALKFRAKGYPPTVLMLKWMHGIDDQVIGNYLKNTDPEIRSNLYYWSGVDAALSALLSRSPTTLDYQNTVWREAIDDIRPDGTLGREMKRGQRALIYHMYAFSALTVLRVAREALHFSVAATETHQLRLLAYRIGKTICHPDNMARRAGVTEMEMPGEWGYRINTIFGKDLITDDWRTCGIISNKPNDVRMGGLATFSLDAIRGVR